jgi:hypothetical protein
MRGSTFWWRAVKGLWVGIVPGQLRFSTSIRSTECRSTHQVNLKMLAVDRRGSGG